MKSLKHLIVICLLKSGQLFRYIKSFWHENFLCELKPVGITRKLHKPLENYLSGILQRVLLNGNPYCGDQFWHVFHKDQLYVHSFFSFTSMNYLTQNTLLMTRLFIPLLKIKTKVLMFSTMIYY